jgi:hypothetical protein
VASTMAVRVRRQFRFGRGTQLLLAFTAGAVVCSATVGSRMWGYFREVSSEQTREFEQQVSAAAVAGQKAAQVSAASKAALALDMKEHPEKYRVSFTRTWPVQEPGEEIAQMPSAKAQQEVGTAYSGNLLLVVGPRVTAAPDVPIGTSVSASSGGAWASIANISAGNWIGNHVQIWGEDSPAVRAAFDAWATLWPDAVWAADWWCFATSASQGAPGDPASITDRTIVVVGLVAIVGEEPQSPTHWVGQTEITADFTISLAGAKRHGEITQTLSSGHSGLMHPAQRTGTGTWWADASTTVTATCGEATVTANYGVGSETDITSALGVTLAIAYNSAPDIHTDYARITLNQGIGLATPRAVNLANWTFYKDTGSGTWHWHGTTFEPGFTEPDTDKNTFWKTVASGSTLSVQRCAGGSGGTSISETAAFNQGEYENHLWKANKQARTVTGGLLPYTDYDASAGHPFDIGLFKHWVSAGVRQTDAQVSVAPNWTPVEWQEQWAFGTPIPEDLWRVFVNSAAGYYCNLREDWCVANDEDVPFTDPLTTETATGDVRQAVTFHDLVTDLEDPPWEVGWCTWARVELNLDKPPNTSNTRPSAFTGSGGATVLGEVWTVPSGGGTVARTLATRRRNRIIRFAAHQWPTLAEVSHDWPIMTRANLDIGTTGDDPHWRDPNATPHAGEEVGCAYEDVTDWRGLSCVKLTLTSMATAPSLRLTYRTLTGSDPLYLGATWNFGSEGEAEASWSTQQVATITPRGDSPAGTAIYDLAPNVGEAALDLELVELVEFVFPAGAQEVTLAGWETVPYDAAHPVNGLRMRMAHLHATDLWGAEVSVDGGPDYPPSYLYGIVDAERVEVGYKHTQPWQHDPDYQGEPDDPSALKTLARWYNEQCYAETLYLPTWSQATIDAHLKDVDGVTLGTPVWNDYDEDGFCLHVGLSVGNYLTYCDCILQGGVRGIAKWGPRRQTSKTTGVKLYYSDDAGATTTLVRNVGTGYAGEYRVGAGCEKTPRTYYVNTISLGGFVNNEERWAAVKLPPQGQDDMAHFPQGRIPIRPWFADGVLKVCWLDDGYDDWVQAAASVDSSGNYINAAAETDGTTLWVTAQNIDTEALYGWYSTDMGEVWHGPTAI